MTAQIIEIRDYQRRRDLERLYNESGNDCAIAASIALISSEPLGKPFEDVLFSNLEQMYITDTSPCEYVAPDQDSA